MGGLSEDRVYKITKPVAAACNRNPRAALLTIPVIAYGELRNDMCYYDPEFAIQDTSPQITRAYAMTSRAPYWFPLIP